MFYDIVSFPVWLLVAALVGSVVGWMTYTDATRRGWFDGWAKWGAIAFAIGLIVAVLKLLPGRAGLWLEIALLMTFIYILGCLLGGWLKGLMLEPEQRPAVAEVVVKAEADPQVAAAKAESDRLATEAAATVEADREAAAAKADSDRLAAEAAAKAESDRQAAAVKAESVRLAAEVAAKAGADRQAAAAKADSDRLAAEAAAKAEADRRAAAATAESDRLAMEAAAKAEADRRAAAATAESDRLAMEAAAKAEANRQAAAATAESDRLAAEAAAKAEADRQAAAATAESDRLATEAAAKAEADRRAAAATAESDRLAAEAAAKAEADRQAAVVVGPGVMPVALAAADGAADDLKLIKGIGPKNEQALNGLGVYHFSQIADWTPDNAIWMGHHMAFPGRIERENWIPQAKLLGAGIDTEHSTGVKSGTIRIDDSADAPMAEAEAISFAASMPAMLPTVEGEGRHPGSRPLGLAAPRGGVADDLKRIKGIGKQNEARLHGLGVWHFDQIAAWSAQNVKWVGSYLAFSGRIDREKWVSQSSELAAGRKTEFARRVDAGLVKTSRDDGSHGQDNIAKVEPKGD
jgi:predicted flap endonuclease-1-like 5' DNA nuclease